MKKASITTTIVPDSEWHHREREIVDLFVKKV